MTTQLEPTGERLIEDAYHRNLGGYVIYVMHAASYRFAEPLCAGKRVIDLGCGSGYGAARIAKIAEWVDAVDVSEDAVSFARERYRASNLHYSRIAADAPLPFHDQTFDVVLSFQVIEHVERDVAYLMEARRVLKSGGVMIVITPDRKHRLLPKQKPWNRWHVREYSAESLREVVGKVFEVEQAWRMGAPWHIAGIEHRRYRWLKWLTLPITAPFIPEAWRRAGLDLMHVMRPRPVPVASEAVRGNVPFGFDEQDLILSEEAPHSLNLVLVARKP